MADPQHQPRARAAVPHPRIARFGDLLIPAASAAELGYRMPAEWEAQSCVWVSPPTNSETWPRCLMQASRQFDAWVDELRRFAPVCTPQSLGISTDDAWVRDYGPIFVVRDQASGNGDGAEQEPATRRVDRAVTTELALHDFFFNSWGGKYEGARPRDDMVPQHLARWLGSPIWVHDFALEGGAIEPNGRGTLLTTEQCLLNPNRNPGASREKIEAILGEAFNATRIIWLPGGITGDDTDGHVDDVARFVNADTVAAATAPEGHPDHDMLARNLQVLRRARDQDGNKLNIIELPMPEPIFYDYPPDRFDEGGRQQLPASHANFLIANGGVFVPTFGQASDEQALRIMEQAMPDHEIVPVRSEWLVVGLGAMHCLSMPQPAVRYNIRGAVLR
ncbi:MAG: agmatine deiminase family protein [Phycisphaeraceae bacterium]